jgi:CheY-like chemotaxis protein
LTEATPTVLLIQSPPADSEPILRAVRGMKRSALTHVIRDVQAALEFLRCEGPYATRDPEQRPAIILLDLDMPADAGFEALRRIKGDASLRTLPVVVMASQGEEEIAARAYELGANSFIVKLPDPEAFERMLQSVLSYWFSVNQGLGSA